MPSSFENSRRPVRARVSRRRPAELLVILVVLLAGGVGTAYLVGREISPDAMQPLFVPVSLLSRQIADYGVDARADALPAARLDIVADVIRDQEPDADVAARYAQVQANMLTPVAWLLTPTPSATPTRRPTATPTGTPVPTRTPTMTPTPTLAPTPADPWIPVGQGTVACDTEIALAPVNAGKWRFRIVGGGGEDHLVSFDCCGSSGVEWLADNRWLPVTLRSLTLSLGEWRESVDLAGAVATRMRFRLGCNDAEKVDVRVDYLPALSQSRSPAPSPVSSPAIAIATTSPAVPGLANLATVEPIRPRAPTGSIAFHCSAGGSDRICLVNLDEKTTTTLVDTGPVLDLTLDTYAPIGVWSPDKSGFAYVSTVGPGAPNVLKVLDLRTNATRILSGSDVGGGLSSPSWSPDGRQIAFVRAASGLKSWAVVVLNVDGSKCSDRVECEIRRSDQAEQFRGGLEWSAQGSFALGMNNGGANDLYLLSNGGELQSLVVDAADDAAPAWSPDGTRLAFTSTRDGYPQIYVVNRDGSELHRVSRGGAAAFSPTWSPDGQWIAFASQRNGAVNLFLMDQDGANVTALTDSGGDRPSWSR